MASLLHDLASVSLCQSTALQKAQAVIPFGSRFLSTSSVLRLKERAWASRIKNCRLGKQKHRPGSAIYATQSNLVKVLQTVWRVGKDGIEAGTNLVPDSIPRPVARASVTIAVFGISLFILKSFLSTAFFVLATMGLAYFLFIALNKEQGSTTRGSSGSTSSTKPMDDPVEEARRIMEKYK